MPGTLPDFDLLTSLRYDPKLLTAAYNTDVNGIELPYLFFRFHIERLAAAAAAFGWSRAASILRAPGATQRLLHMCDQAVMESPLTGKEKGIGLRILLSFGGEFRIEAHALRPLTSDLFRAAYFNPTTSSPDNVSSPIFTVYLDSKSTPSSLFTSHKTTAREHYTAARDRAGLKTPPDRRDPREVLMVNDRGEVTECSTRNIAFWRGDGWVTPSERAGALPGTVRRYLLERGIVREGTIRASDVRSGEWVLLSNGWDGTLLGRICKD